MAFDKFKNMFKSEDLDVKDDNVIAEEEYYNVDVEEVVNDNSKMVLIEPRAYSEAQEIADCLKNRYTVVVNLKRVTSEQAKRIIDFLSGCIYAIGGDMQKVGGGIFLCAPKNVDVEGKITDESDEAVHNNDDIEIDW